MARIGKTEEVKIVKSLEKILAEMEELKCLF